MKLEALSVQFKLSGADVPASVLRVRYAEGLSELFELDMLLTLARSDADSAEPGTECSVIVTRGQDDSNVRKVHGIIMSAEQLDEGDNHDLEHPLMRLRIVPRVWRTSLVKRTRVFVEKSVDDVIKKTLTDGGLDPFEGKADTVARPLLVQYQETDLDFMARLLEDCGVTHFFDHSGLEEKWNLVDADADKTRLGEPRPLTWTVLQQGQSDEEGVVRAGRRTAMGSTVVKTIDVDRRMRSMSFQGTASGQNQAYVREWREPWRLGAKDALDLAKQFLEEGGMDREAFWLETSDIQLRAGERVNAELSQGDAIAGNTRELLVVRVEHEIELAEERLVYRNRADVVNINRPFRPARVTPRPLILAPQTGIVKEFLPSKSLEITITMDWNATPLDIPVRVPQPIAARDHGSVLLPHPGTEVLVHFIDGIPERPVLLGALYNNETPSSVNPKSKPYTSHFAMLGARGTTNTIDVDDNTQDAEKTTMKVINDVNVTVGRHEVWTVEGNVTEALKKDVKTDVGGKRNSTVKGDETYETDGAVSITVQKSGRVLVSDSLQMTADTKLSLVSGNTRADFSPSSAKITVGASVIEMTAGSIKITAPLVSINNGSLDVL